VYGVATASFDGMEMIDDCMLPVILPNLQAECAFCASIVGKVFMYVWTITLPLLNSKVIDLTLVTSTILGAQSVLSESCLFVSPFLLFESSLYHYHRVFLLFFAFDTFLSFQV
jgi:hypothetical protein